MNTIVTSEARDPLRAAVVRAFEILPSSLAKLKPVPWTCRPTFTHILSQYLIPSQTPET